MSAVVGRGQLLEAWRRDAEVVHTSTFAGNALSAATSLATLDVLSRERLPERAARVGAQLMELLEPRLARFEGVRLRGQGLMIAIDLGDHPGRASLLARAMLARGYITSTGGGRREVLILTPALTLKETLLPGFVEALEASIGAL